MTAKESAKPKPGTTGLVQINPWGALEWVTVRASSTPGVFRVVYDNEELFTAKALSHEQLVEVINKQWRQRFPK
jgi:hypothetical protein